MLKMAILVCGIFVSIGSAAAAKLPDGIKWQTNENVSPLGSPEAKRGGVYKTFILEYPLTFRLWGPNSNDRFSHYNRKSCLKMNLVERHKNTRELVPVLATHWAVMSDQKTVYYKLRKEVKFSDGVSVTADHYVFAYEMMRSDHIKAPYYNKYFKEQFESIEKIDDYTLKIVGKYANWQAIDKYAIWPVAKHSFKLDKNWVKKNNWKPPVCVGPYTIWKPKKGRSVKLKRIDKWWGDQLPYFKGRYNFDVIDLKVIRDQRVAFEHFKKGNLSQYYEYTSSAWETGSVFEAVKKGWVSRRKIYVKKPAGKYGFFMNLKNPKFQDKNFRKALQHLFDFKKINKNLMYNAYFRIHSFFPGTEYANEKLPIYEYSIKKATVLLKKAGFKKRGSDGILQNSKGIRASIVLTYDSKGLTRHISVVKEDFKEAGVELNLRLVDGAKGFADSQKRNYEMILSNRTAQFFPEIEQYLHSDYAKKIDNNNISGFANVRVDKLLKIYNEDMNFKKRVKATHEIDEIVKEAAFYIPFWKNPYKRSLAWYYIGHPKYWEAQYSENNILNEFDLYWFDADKKKKLDLAMKQNKKILGTNDVLDVDEFGVLGK